MENVYGTCLAPGHVPGHVPDREAKEKREQEETRTSIRVMFGLFMLMSFDDVAVTGGE